MPFKTILLVLLFTTFYGSSTACFCTPSDDKERVCSSDFAGVVEITGLTEPRDNLKCDSEFKCWTVTVLEAFNRTITSTNAIKTSFSSASCGVADVVPNSGKAIVSGYAGDGGTSVILGSCSYVLKPVTGLDDPQVKEYRDFLDSCPKAFRCGNESRIK